MACRATTYSLNLQRCETGYLVGPFVQDFVVLIQKKISNVDIKQFRNWIVISGL